MVRSFFILCAVWLLVPSRGRAEEPTTIQPMLGWVGAVAFSPSGEHLAVGGSSGSVKLWDVASKQFNFSLLPQRSAIVCLAFAPDGRGLFTGSHDQTISGYGLRGSGKPTGERTFSGKHRGAVYALVVMPNGKSLWTGSIDGTIRLWNLETKRESRVLQGHTSWVNGLSLSKDASLLASAGSDNTVRLWDTKTWKNTATLTVKEGEVRSVALSPDGKRIAAGIRYGHVRVWDIETKKELFSAKPHEGETWALAFTPDGKTLCSGGGDWNKPSEVRLWDTATWKERAILKHTGEVLCLSVSGDGKRLAAGGWDGKVLVWELPRP